ncbi:MAG: glycoside hydrolase family 3 N-terminal domain-containing protein [Anaerolineaceae bacterium]|nr:glycoside hydrolase family 3 N-terminal domain-containing protein [Anaerolineaceae bacterium]
MKSRQVLVRIFLTLMVLVTINVPFGTALAQGVTQNSDPGSQVKTLMAQMTPEQKVGQLFLVTFKGRDAGKNSQIYDLITNHSIGGVVLTNSNDNFTGPDGTVTSAYNLVSDLQNDAGQVVQGISQNSATQTPMPSPYIPLFIGISQEGDLYPYDQIINGLTPLPDPMAIGATWKPDLAAQVGSILGSELSALGFNLYFGPSLDVLNDVTSDTGQNLGTRTFGGDPYWVGQMGQAYIQGIHSGSGGEMLVIAKHFPGSGGSDRPPEEEVATVRKSLEQLKQIELAPFFNVTGNSPSADATTDGLLVSSIRYQGFQGNIRDTTLPVSFDRTALDQLMALPAFASWRQNGGLMVSDDLGSQAVRRFFDPTSNNFDSRQIAQNAFLAGNDILYMDNITATGDPDSYTTILRTLQLFAQKYRVDPAFSQRVDLSVQRILTAKYRLYPNFDVQSVVPSQDGLAKIGQSQQVTFDVAQKAVTLISPDAGELSSILPRSPQLRERVVFITDVRTAKQCSQCADQSALAVDALQNSVLKLYGPRAGGQVMQTHLSSYAFSDLTKLLIGTPPTGTQTPPMLNDLRLADWVVFSTLNLETDAPDSNALRRLLSEQPDLLRNKKVIVFAFNAPYYLDATDISKLTAYYVLYSKTPALIDVAARVLFQELAPTGVLPVSVPGVGYDLSVATSPDPNQVIPLFVDQPGFPQPQDTTTPPISTTSPTPIPTFKVGDTLPLRTGAILDHNHNLVPDGTVVHFIMTTGGDTGSVQQIDTTTSDGIAHAAFLIQSSGSMDIRVKSDPAEASEILSLNISPGQSAAITAIAPTVAATATLQPTMTLTPTGTPSPTPTPEAPAGITFGRWLIFVLLIWGSAAGIYWIGSRRISLRWGVRWGLLSAFGGLVAYIYIDNSQSTKINSAARVLTPTALLVTLCGILLGWLSGYLWRYWIERRARMTIDRTPTSSKPLAK